MGISRKENVMTFKVILFDFDGVIVESNHVKEAAFSEVFKNYPSKFEEIQNYHLSNYSQGRFDKFKYILQNITHTYTEKLYLELCNEYQRITRDGVVNCKNVTGNLITLQTLSKKFPLYIATATPQIEIEWILKQRDLTPYFKKAYGTPNLKFEIIKIIVEKENIKPNEILFIGDSKDDFLTAKKAGTQFIGRKSASQFNNANFSVVNDLSEFLELIEKNTYIKIFGERLNYSIESNL